MHEPFIGNTGPSLGALSVYTKVIEADGNVIKKPIWKLYNHQGPEWRYAQALIQEEKAFTVMQPLVKFVNQRAYNYELNCADFL